MSLDALVSTDALTPYEYAKLLLKLYDKACRENCGVLRMVLRAIDDILKVEKEITWGAVNVFLNLINIAILVDSVAIWTLRYGDTKLSDFIKQFIASQVYIENEELKKSPIVHSYCKLVEIVAGALRLVDPVYSDLRLWCSEQEDS